MLADIVEKAERTAGGGNNKNRIDAKSIMRVEPRGNRRIGNGNLRMCERTHIYTQEKPKRKSA